MSLHLRAHLSRYQKFYEERKKRSGISEIGGENGGGTSHPTWIEIREHHLSDQKKRETRVLRNRSDSKRNLICRFFEVGQRRVVAGKGKKEKTATKGKS